MTNAPKLVVFDCDGTLANSHAFIVRVAREAFAHAGSDVPLDSMMNEFLSMPFDAFFKTLDAHMSGEQVQKAYDYMRDTLRSERDSGAIVEPVYDGIHDMLKILDEQGYLLGVATNKQAHGLESVLKSNGILKYFATLQHCSNSSPKPSPDMLLNAMAATGAERGETIMIGDSTADILTARNAGVKVIAVAWGNQPIEQLVAAGVDGVAKRPADVVTLVQELLV